MTSSSGMHTPRRKLRWRAALAGLGAAGLVPLGIVGAQPFLKYDKGWRSLVDKKKSSASELRGHTPIVFWDMLSYGTTDAAFPILDNYRHGGNGAIFFGG